MAEVAPREGFSLLEILVALAVFALAAMALLNLSGESVRTAARVQDRTLGGIVADNVAAEAALGMGTDSTGQTVLAGRQWTWRRDIQPTGVAGLERIEVRVSPQEDATDEAARRIVFRTTGRS